MSGFMREECPSCKRDILPDEITGDQLTGPNPPPPRAPVHQEREVVYRCDCGAAWKHALTASEVDTFRRIDEEARCRGLR